jgi:hypothetical protein
VSHRPDGDAHVPRGCPRRGYATCRNGRFTAIVQHRRCRCLTCCQARLRLDHRELPPFLHRQVHSRCSFLVQRISSILSSFTSLFSRVNGASSPPCWMSRCVEPLCSENFLYFYGSLSIQEYPIVHTKHFLMYNRAAFCRPVQIISPKYLCLCQTGLAIFQELPSVPCNFLSPYPGVFPSLLHQLPV